MLKFKPALLALICALALSACSNTAIIDFDDYKNWNYFEEGGNYPYRYDITRRWFEHDKFGEEPQANILKELFENLTSLEINDGEALISYDVKFRNPNFIIGVNPYETVGVLELTFGEDGKVVKAEYYERKNAKSEYILKETWGG